MKVILLQAIPKVGKKEDVVEVNEGYARNALFPRRLAIPATETALAELIKKQSSRAADKAVRRSLLDSAINELNEQTLALEVPANEKGTLFSKIDALTIADFLIGTHRLSIDPSCIHLPEGGIKTTGEYHILIKDGSYESSIILQVKKK
ncbi:50S ribosomal protein L9 [Candidatus Nomurabacteria bacterium]|nr:50S ribosomal protein L9 [Candidatus Nomurabacteria bacterium]